MRSNLENKVIMLFNEESKVRPNLESNLEFVPYWVNHLIRSVRSLVNDERAL